LRDGGDTFWNGVHDDQHGAINRSRADIELGGGPAGASPMETTDGSSPIGDEPCRPEPPCLCFASSANSIA
jgi:hypothetical protein